MKKIYLLPGLLCLLLTSACAPEVQTLQRQITELKATIVDKDLKNNELSDDLASCNSLSSALGKEKRSKDQNMMALKGKTRAFLKEEFDNFNTFSRNDELMDYMGGELLSRKEIDGVSLTVVNLKAMPADSVIYSVKGKFVAGTTFFPQLFRPTSKGNLCVWQGKMLKSTVSGVVTLDLDTPLNVLKGDYLGFYFPEKAGITYDTRTGNFAITNNRIELGEKLPSTYANKNRTYSIGVKGFLN